MSEKVKATARQVKINVDDAFWELGDACPVQTSFVQDAVKNGLVFKVRNWVGQQPEGAAEWVVIATPQALQDVDDKEAFVAEAVENFDHDVPNADWFHSKRVEMLTVKKNGATGTLLYARDQARKLHVGHLMDDVQWLVAKVVLPAAA